MPLEEILKRIEEEAAGRRKEVEDRTSAEAEEIFSRADARIEKLRKQNRAETAAEIDNEKKRRLALKRLDLRNKLLEVKHEIINEVFEQAFEKIRSLPDEKYMELVQKLFLDFAEPGKGRVYISGKDKDRILPEFISRLLGKLNDSGGEYDYELADDYAEIEGGFIIETRNTKIDCSLEALFLETRNRLERETGEFLFKNG